FPDPRPDRRQHPRDGPEERLPRPQVRAVPDPAAVGRPGLDRVDRLEVDPRLALQRHQLGAHPAAPRQRVQSPDVARPAFPRDDVRDPGPYLAHAPLRDRDHPGRVDRDPQGHPGGGGGGRRRVLPARVPDRAADDAADHQRGCPLRSDLHVHGHDGRLHPDARRPLRHDPGAPVARLLHRDSRQRPRGRGRDLALRRSRPRPRRVAHAPDRAPRGGDMKLGLRARERLGKVVHWTVLAVFSILLAFPFYWMLITSFKRNPDLYNLKNNPFIFNQRPTLEHLKLLFNETLFLRWLGNTLFAGIVVVTITLLLAVPAAYALTRLTGRWGGRVGIEIGRA